MFFLFNNKTSFQFSQKFNNVDQFLNNDETIIYDLTKSNFTQYLKNNNQIESSTFSFKVFIIDNYILFNNLITNKITSYEIQKKNEIFNDDKSFEIIYQYKQIPKEKIPPMLDSDYQQIFYYDFQTFKIKENIFIIFEKNKLNQTIKQYLISLIN